MPGPIAYARAELVKALEPLGIPVHQTMPPVVQPPAILLTEGTPLTTSDEETFGSLRVHFELIALVPSSLHPRVQLTQLDALTDQIIYSLLREYAVNVSAYQTFTFPDSKPTLGAKIPISIALTIEKD